MKMLAIVVLLCVVVCDGSKVLVVTPAASRGHTANADSIVKILLSAGHEVTYISSSSKMKSDMRLTRVNISSVDQDPEGGTRILLSHTTTLTFFHKIKGSTSTIPELMQDPRSPQRILAKGTEYARRLLNHEAVQGLLSDIEEKYDAIVAEWYFSGLLAPLAAIYDCPLIWFSSLDASWMSLQLVHEQTSPVYTVDSLATAIPSQPYDITSRLSRLWRQVYLTAWIYYTTYHVEEAAYQTIYHPYFKLRDRLPPNYEALVYNGSLLLINSHPLLGQSLALPANVKYVGGHHLDSPQRPLPKILQNILDSAKHGAILFSLGSQVESNTLPVRLKKELLQMFSYLEQVVIWKTSEKFDHMPGNVFTWNWLPQKNILNHSNTIMFISNGGFTSLIEATYYGVPVIGISLTSDQFVNVDLARARGRAIRVDYSDRLAYDIKSAVNEILGNYSYRDNAKQAAAVFRSNVVSPQNELRHHIELVINTKGAYPLRSPARDLSTVQALNLDAVILLLLVLWFISKVIKVIKVHTTNEDEDEDKKNK